MPKSIIDLKDIVRLGGGVSVDATTKNPNDLKGLARLANTSGATIIIRNADSKSINDIKDIARLAPGKVIFEF